MRDVKLHCVICGCPQLVPLQEAPVWRTCCPEHQRAYDNDPDCRQYDPLPPLREQEGKDL